MLSSRGVAKDPSKFFELLLTPHGKRSFVDIESQFSLVGRVSRLHGRQFPAMVILHGRNFRLQSFDRFVTCGDLSPQCSDSLLLPLDVRSSDYPRVVVPTSAAEFFDHSVFNLPFPLSVQPRFGAVLRASSVPAS